MRTVVDGTHGRRGDGAGSDRIDLGHLARRYSVKVNFVTGRAFFIDSPSRVQSQCYDFYHSLGRNGAALSARIDRRPVMNNRFTDRSRTVGALWRDVIRRALTTVDAMSLLVRLPVFFAALALVTQAATAQGPQAPRRKHRNHQSRPHRQVPRPPRQAQRRPNPRRQILVHQVLRR